MTNRKKIGVFSAGCSACTGTIEIVKKLAGNLHDVVVHDMHKIDVAKHAKELGVPQCSCRGDRRQARWLLRWSWPR